MFQHHIIPATPTRTGPRIVAIGSFPPFPRRAGEYSPQAIPLPFFSSTFSEVFVFAAVTRALLLLLIHTFSVLSLQLKKLRRRNKSAIDRSNANPACGQKEVRRSTGHIMVTTCYSDQQGSKSRQKVMRLYKQWHRPISKRFIKSPYSISRATSIDSECCRLPTTSVLGKKTEKLPSTSFDQQVQVSQGHTSYRNKKN